MVSADLPEAVREHLLRRWREPHRHYHGESHLTTGLAALAVLGGGALERIAFWCHDAVHHNATPDDEIASAELAAELLGEVLGPREVDEVCRLILVTATHSTFVGDARGERVCDADLHALGSSWDKYRANVAGIRAEVPGIGDEEWRAIRLGFVTRMLSRESVFATPAGRLMWESRARRNLAREGQARQRDQDSASNW